jgi:hypothetical protein
LYQDMTSLLAAVRESSAEIIRGSRFGRQGATILP